MNLNTPLQYTKGIGPNLARKLSRLNLLIVEDLIHHYPFRYDDFSQILDTSEAKIGEKVTLKGEVWSIKNIYTRYRKVLTQAVFNDGTTSITLTWFNQPWLTKNIQTGDKLQISGKINKYKNKLTIVSPVWEKISDHVQPQGLSLHTGRLVPVYPETLGLTSKWFRSKIDDLLPQIEDQITDPLPDFIKANMLSLSQALKQIHFPKDLQDASKARERLAFDELFVIQLATQKARMEWRNKPLVEPFKINNEKIKQFIQKIPFQLTEAQNKVINEVIEDLKKNQPMNRLVQGEVGSGKTVVAAIITYIVYLNGFKTYFMAPTEILAFQHLSTFKNLLEPFGLQIGIYTGSKKFTKNNESGLMINEKSQQSIPDITIGTHALLSNKLMSDNVGLVIVDEQQRFGVDQRSYLRKKAKVPHFLTMTATPIPRTVALTIYGDLDISIIDQLPKGRQKVKTYVVPSKKRADAYKFIEKKVIEGDQVYIITPLIEQSETLVTAKAAKVEFERLQKEVFPKLKLGLLHGKLPSKEKEKIINEFKNNQINILVSTSVVEVGVDVTNATIMVIEGAERFGLAQLHQLRGRVGRGKKQSFCLLFPSIEESSLIRRLKNLENTYDGLKLAELDLKIRGAGEIFGTKQSGRFELKIASFSNLPLIEKTKMAAQTLLSKDPKLDKYPQLAAKLHSLSPDVMPD